MDAKPTIPASRDKLLFTPGPLTTSLSVKQAMLHDAGSWHFDFAALVRSLREKLLALTGTSREEGYEAVLMQGSGTFGVESVIGSTVPPDGKLLVIVNGAYGRRIALMAERLKINAVALICAEDAIPDLDEIQRLLITDPGITNVAAVHCETTTGILNPIDEIGRAIQSIARSRSRERDARAPLVYIVDAISSFAAIPIDLAGCGIDYLISSANKCIEGVPGFSFILARRDAMLATEGFARSLSLDLLGQWKAFEKNGQFRYTPPTHAILAFDQALRELDQEGGVPGRAARYRNNHETLLRGMREMGFHSALDPAHQSYIITSFYYPSHPNFHFDEFYRRLSDKGMIIYPGKLTQIDCFRIGTIGRIFESDLRCLLAAIRETLTEMSIPVPLPGKTVI